MLGLLKAYQKRLTNLSSSNKSLLLLRLSAEQFLDLHELDFLLGTPSFAIIEGLIARQNRIPLCDALDSRSEKVNEAAKRLRRVARTAAFIAQERGAQDLYVGYPMAAGKLTDGTPVRAPLLFFPVDLTQETNQWTLQPREGETPQFNKSLLLAYAHFNQVRITDEWLETDFEDFDRDSRAFRTQLYELLKRSPLEVNFNQDTFADKLRHFQPYAKADFEEAQRNGEIKLFPEAVLGIFPQAGSYFAPDYDYLIEHTQFADLEEFLAPAAPEGGAKNSPPLGGGAGGGASPFGGRGAEASFLTPLPVDASQEQAIRLVKSGQSVVVQGPPGTGKSQFIANLMADYAARGKRVLLVCQKRAALDVVYQRLSHLGMADFMALVHDFKQDRKPIFEQVNRQIESLDEYKRLNISLDAVYLERNFADECRRIEKLSDELETFRQALFDDTACGLPVKELYLTSNPAEAHVPLKSAYKHFQFGEIDDFMRRLAAYAFHRRLDQPVHLWHQRVSFHDFSQADQTRLVQSLTEIPETARSVCNQVARVVGPLNVADLEIVSASEPAIRELLAALPDQTHWEIFQHYMAGHNAEINAKWLDKHEKAMLRCLDGESVEKTTPTNQLATALAQTERASAARQNALTWLRWQWFSGERKAVRQLAVANRLIISREDLGVLGEKLQKRIALEKLAAELRQAWPLENPYEETTARLWFGQQRTARRAFKIARKLNAWPLLESLIQHTHAVFQEKIHQLLAIADEWQLAKSSWRLYLTNAQIAETWQQPESVPGRIAALERDFDNLCELDGIKRRLSHAESEVVKSLLKHEAGFAENADWPRIFDNSLRLAWIEHIEAKHPVLRTVSTYKMRQTEDELQEAVRKKQHLSREMLLLKLREQTYRHITLNRLGNRTTYRDLQHQTAKKRHVWTLRKLLSTYADEVFKLVPCWLASPESVSAISPLPAPPKSPHPQPFPQGGREQNSPLLGRGAGGEVFSSPLGEAGWGLFDLVIFDEASQCYAERGIPAMYRGAQVVVTGDSQQLQPNDLYRIRYEEDTDDQPDLEVDSLLDLAMRYLPQTQLRGHYRSQSLELIDFSNRHFYGGNLELLPDFRLVNRQEPAIAYLKVDGLWQNNQNRPEADAVVDLVWRLVAQQPDKEIGVVTFNFQQQTLIQDLLEATATEQNRMLPPSLFVKNIENVQGDERDIIIFSIGYAPDTAGRLVMQFGSLNQQGGENRLNVAVTRAREKIYLISSLLPHQLRTDGTLHAGPKLLRQYLEYAWQVSAGEYVPQPRPVRDFVSGHLLKDRLVDQPHALPSTDESTLAVKELPFADVTVKHNGRYDSLVLTDDDLYYQSPSAKAAHAYTPMLLQAKNWRYKRIYSREWWKNRSEGRG